MKRTNVARKGSTARRLRKAVLYQGLLSRVANELGRSRSHVFRVANGERRSRPIEQALIREMERIDRAA